jgi:DNA-binding NtrC family response regulator
MSSILILEDDLHQRAALEEYIREFMADKKTSAKRRSYEVYSAAEIAVAKTVFAQRPVDLVISDLMLPDGTGIDFLKEARRINPNIPFLIMTAQPTIETAVEAIRSGANDYLLKPIEFPLLKEKIERLLENSWLKEENIQLRSRLNETFRLNKFIGNSKAIQDVLDKVRQVADTDVTVLIEGESGTGKELIANLLHENSARRSGPLIRVNCGALTKSILESELFGSVKGAFTGSDRDRAGLFESAHGGTIFLDEIGEMDLESQVRLLRVIESREVMRVGSSKAIPIDVRIITATNKSLVTQVEDGEFREDLYYRLAVIKLTLPALRERTEDLPLLFNQFIIEFNEKYGKSVTGMSPELLSLFQAYHWPGNIRQFRNVLEAMTVLARDDILQKSDLPQDMTVAPRRDTASLSESIIPGVKMDDYEKAIIEKNLHFCHENRLKAAELLGISERTLYRKIKDYNL